MSAKKTKEVAIAEETALTTVDVNGADDGFDCLDQSDMVIPRIVIGQAQHDIANEHKGAIYNTVSGDSVPEMEMVIVKLAKSRVLFPDKFSRDSKPICKSKNGKFPVTNDAELDAQADNCAVCEYAQWTKEDGRNVAPRCKEAFDMLVLNMEDFTPAWFTCKSTHYTPAKKIISTIAMRSKAKGLPAFAFSFKLSIGEDKRDSGSSYLPIFSGVKPLDAETLETMLVINKSLQSAEVAPEDFVASSEEPEDDF